MANRRVDPLIDLPLQPQVFQGQYPQEWYVAKLFTIYKKGYNLAALAKIYDSILNSRFTKWFTPDEEQAGGQAGRGCAEHLLTVRLYIDIARKTKQTLFVLFVDYEKAYDRVNRNHLLNPLATAGCGNTFLRAIGEYLRHTQNKLGNETFVSKHGVRQGGATSCSLFTFYINSAIRKIKTYGPDGFLRDTHTLLFMDDTALYYSHLTGGHGAEAEPPTLCFLCLLKRPFTTQGIVISHTQKYVGPIPWLALHERPSECPNRRAYCPKTKAHTKIVLIFVKERGCTIQGEMDYME